MKIFAFVFARGNSKGLPGKNIKKLNGKHLISYSISISKKIKKIDKCFVSTDCDKIATVAKKNGAVIIKRPKILATDNSPEFHSWKHAVKKVIKKFGHFDYFVSLPATSPLRSINDIENSLNLFLKENKKTDVVITATPANRNPWFNMIKINKNDFVTLVNKSKHKYFRRQDAPIIYDVATSCYITSVNFILKNKNIWDGKVKAYIIPKERSIDIDNLYDFKIAEYLIKNNTKN